MKSRNVLAAIVTASAIVLTAAPAAAQFTTFVPPRKAAVADTAPTQAAAEQADSVQRQTLTDMKVWVDSAARALAVNVDTAAAIDSLVVDSLAGDVVQATERAPTTEFREGAPAPDTATMFPMLAVAALGCLGAGALLLRRGGA